MKFTDLPDPLQKEVNNWYYANINSIRLPDIQREAWINVFSSIKNKTDLSTEALVLILMNCLYVESRPKHLSGDFLKCLPEFYLIMGFLRELKKEDNDKESKIIKLKGKKYLKANSFLNEEWNEVRTRLC